MLGLGMRIGGRGREIWCEDEMEGVSVYCEKIAGLETGGS
jgi:hypothetical protein